jgi:hypothetical protein
MFSKWVKARGILRFTIHSITFGKVVDSRFNVAWTRGKSKGQTDELSAARYPQLTFNADFECSCTVFQNKSDGSIRPKFLKFLCNRINGKGKEQVYGRASIDVGKYYGNIGHHIKTDMESGHEQSPLLDLTIEIRRAGEMNEMTPHDETDVSFMDTSVNKIAFGQWDRSDSDTGRSDEKPGEDRSHHKRKKPSGDTDEGQKRKRKHRGDYPPVNDQAPPEKPTYQLKRLDDRSRVSRIGEERRLREEEERRTAEARRIEEERRLQEDSRMADEEARLNAESSPGDDSFLAKDHAEKSRLTGSDRIRSAHDWLCIALSHDFPSPSRPIYLDTDKSFPLSTSATGIFVTLLHIHFFTDLPEPDFRLCFSALESQFVITPETSRDQFTIVLAIANIVQNSESQLHFASDRSSQFLTFCRSRITQAVESVLHFHESELNVIGNRFITAKFEYVSLLEDMSEVLGRTRAALNFGRDANKRLLGHLLADFEVKTANKMFANPSRFIFTNAIVWNTFVSAVDSDLRITLPLLREVVLAINMAPTIAEKPEIAREICPHLSLQVIGYLLMMFAPDGAFPTPIDTMRFMETFEIWAVPSEVKLPPVQLTGFDNIPEIKWDRWRDWKGDPATLSKFPFFTDYIAK